MKPRIKYDPSEFVPRWTCVNDKAKGWGFSPYGAYSHWKALIRLGKFK